MQSLSLLSLLFLMLVSGTIAQEKIVICPDGASYCNDGQTCCRARNGGWGCCPAPHAVCCSDGVNCCPNGYVCQVPYCKHQKTGDFLTALQKQPSLSLKSLYNE